MSQIILYDGEQIIHVSRVNRNHANADGAKLGLPERVRVLLAENPGTRAIVIEDGVKARTHHVVQDGGVLHVKRLDVPSDIAARLADAVRQEGRGKARLPQLIRQTVPTPGTIMRRHGTLTVFTAFAAPWVVPFYLGALRRMRLPRGWAGELIWYDNMNDSGAADLLRSYAGMDARWDSITHHIDRVASAESADRLAVAERIVEIYGDWLMPRIATERLFILEHDVMAGPETLERLATHMDVTGAKVVGACVFDRAARRPMAWRVGPRGRVRWSEPGEPAEAVSFSATLFDASTFAQFPLRTKPGNDAWVGADLSMMVDLAQAGVHVEMLWDETCAHLIDKTTTVPPGPLPEPYCLQPSAGAKDSTVAAPLVIVGAEVAPEMSDSWRATESEDGIITGDLLLFIPVGDPQFLPRVLAAIPAAAAGMTVHLHIINNSGVPFQDDIYPLLDAIGAHTIVVDDRPLMHEAGYEVPIRVASFWRTYLQSKLDAPWIWVVEADVIAPANFLPRAMANMQANEGLSAVGAAMFDRHLHHSLCWRYSNVETALLNFCEVGTAPEEVDGLTYSCTLFRREALQSIPPIQWRTITRSGILTGADMYMCRQLKLQGWRMLVLWDIPGIHLRPDGSGISGHGEKVPK